MPFLSLRRRRRILAGAACASALLAPPLVAAVDPDADFSLKDTVLVGPFHIAPFFVLKDFGYDDNTRLDARHSSPDYTVTMGPGARAVAPLGRLAAVSIWDEIDYAVFARESDMNHVNNSLRTKLHIYLRDVTVYADGEQISVRDRPNTEIDYRIRSTTTGGKVGANWQPGTRAKLDLYLKRVSFHYDPGKPDVPAGADPQQVEQAQNTGVAIATELEREETTVGTTGSLRLRPRTSALIDLKTGRVDFDRTDPQRDSSTQSVMGGLEFDPAGPLRGYFKVGLKHLKPDDSRVDGFSGLIADASMSARLFGRGDVRATYQRDTGFSIVGDNLFFILDRKALSYEHYLSSRVSVELGREFDTVDYPIPFEIDPNSAPQHREDDIVWDKVTVRYRFGPSLRMGLSAGRWRRDSTVDDDDTNRNTITTLLEYTP